MRATLKLPCLNCQLNVTYFVDNQDRVRKLMNSNLVERDLKHIWHPCSQMQDYLTFPPLVIQQARGSYLQLGSGDKVIDAISSWWCKNLGHQHPRLKKALKRQLTGYEHVIGANTYQAPLIELSEKLAGLSDLKKVFYASEGSTAVEIAIKMSFHLRYLLEQNHKTGMMSLRNAYHGESVLAMSVSDLSLYRKPYEGILHKVDFLDQIPYVSSINDPLFQNCGSLWPKIETQLKRVVASLSLIIVEPIVQAAGNMKIYSADFLRRLQHFCQQHDIHLIADEIMTGLGRTGYPLACQHANIQPDFICLSKGLTAGFLPLSAVLTRDSYYELCFSEYSQGKAFLHSNTYSGNALAASVAVETLKVLEEENYYEQVQAMAPVLRQHMEEVAFATKRLGEIRSIGAIAAGDLLIPEQSSDPPVPRRYGYEIYKAAVKMGALLRPLGNTIYWTPPFNTSRKTLIKLRDITINAIREVFNNDR